jgi:hypothetical protein
MRGRHGGVTQQWGGRAAGERVLALSGKGWWRKAGTPPACEAMRRQWFKDRGLVCLTDEVCRVTTLKETAGYAEYVRWYGWTRGREAPSHPIRAGPTRVLIGANVSEAVV